MAKAKTTTKDTVKYYYLRDENNHPLVTVCLILRQDQEGLSFGKGLAFCSPQEKQINKKVGRRLSCDRACMALTKKSHFQPIERHEAREIIRATIDEEVGEVKIPIYKGIYNPNLTWFEMRLLDMAEVIVGGLEA
jgi:hypothetical protein